MNDHSSGCYIIDTDYNVVSVNTTAKTLYPQLKTGRKCYACLMGLDEPCGPCPVANGVKGPTSYTDPIRHITEIVDAVDFDIDGIGPCHALVFSTVEDEASFAATLPTNAKELKELALIKALTADYQDVFSVRLSDGSMTLYRHNGKALEADSIYKQITSYAQGIEEYIARHVYTEDQATMREKCALPYLTNLLRSAESAEIHYRVLWNGEIHYYYRKLVRIGEADSFENIVVGVACEDEEVRSREKQIALQNNLRRVEYSIATGLLTKEAFFIHGEKLLRKHPELSFDFCVLVMDNLNSINHQYGKIAGDKSVQLIGEILRTYVKDTSCIAYFGDGMFGSLTENTSTKERTSAIYKFRDDILERSEIKNLSLKWFVYKNISSSVPVEVIYDKIAHALSTLRTNIRQDYVEFDRSVLDQLDWDTYVETNFKKALSNREFKAWYQPKYSVHTQQIIGAEALVRWQLPSGEPVAPERFIPVLENCGLINLLDQEVFRQACWTQQLLSEKGIKTVPISVNLSRASIFTNDIAVIYSGIAESFGIAPETIPIEITESAAVRAAKIREFADSLIEKGFPLHMDDFGAGYSSLASLQSIPFQSIKLDKTLVDFIGKRNGENLLKHTIAFAKESGMSVIAEGVETFEQYMFLKVAGCDAIQGYYFSKPVSQEELLTMLA